MKKFLSHSSLLIITALTSCGGISMRLPFKAFNYDIESKTVKQDISEKGYYQKSKFDSVNYLDSGTPKTIGSLQDYYLARKKSYVKSNTIGEAKMLVIPLHFSNIDENPSLNKYDEKEIIQNAFFGNKEYNDYYSVAEYYMRSSYGAFQIKGTVTDPFYLKEETILPNAKSTSASANTIRNYVIKSMMEEGFDFSPYIEEINGKKYLKNLFFVYDRQYDMVTNDTLWWAFSFNDEYKINDDLYLSNTAWASLAFANYNGKVNAQTYLHETGHLLGLEDYYSNVTYQPTGGFDMMDLNVGDHNGFSKMLFNWVTPKVITEPCTITIRDLYNSGDVLLIPSKNSFKDGNYHPYQEYLLIEHFISSGLNTGLNYTYQTKSGEIFRFPNDSGLKVYHIDARLAYFLTTPRGGKENDKFIKFVSDSETALPSNYHVEYRYRNNDSRTEDGDNVLCHLLESSGNNTFINGKLANNGTLFKDGQGISSYTFHDGSQLSLGFKVDYLSLTTATINFFDIAG